LAELLRGPVPLYARGIAMIVRLLTDGTGPLYASADASALARELRQAHAAING
jgi:hypothetical protein